MRVAVMALKTLLIRSMECSLSLLCIVYAAGKALQFGPSELIGSLSWRSQVFSVIRAVCVVDKPVGFY